MRDMFSRADCCRDGVNIYRNNNRANVPDVLRYGFISELVILSCRPCKPPGVKTTEKTTTTSFKSFRIHYSLTILQFNPLNPELNPICYLLALLGAHHFLHVSRTRVKSLTFRRLMSYIYIYIYIYMEHLFLMFLDHTQRRSTVGRTPLDE